MEREYDAIVKGSLVFSPDSRRLAYGASRGNKSLAVVDGKEGSITTVTASPSALTASE